MYLDLSHNNLSTLHAALRQLELLEVVKLNKNRLTQVDGLASLPALETLELHGNLLTDIRALKDMESLDYLDISDNAISDMSIMTTSLAGFKNLSSLGIKGKRRIEKIAHEMGGNQ